MKINDLIIPLFTLLISGTTLYGQVPGDRSFYAQLSYANVALEGFYEQAIRYNGGGFGRSSGVDIEAMNAPVLGGGYTYQLSRKWSLNWAGDISAWREKNFVEQGLLTYTTDAVPPEAILRGAPRQFLGLNTRLQFFRSIVQRSRWQLSLGAGLSGMLRWHHFRSGYVYDHSISQFEVETFTKERALTLGVPLEARLAIPLNTHWSIGGSMGGDVYFNGDHRLYFGVQVIRHWF